MITNVITTISNEQALLGFSYFTKIGPVKISLLEKYFGQASRAFIAKAFDLERAGLAPNLVNDFITWRKTFNLKNAEDELKKENINYLSWHSLEYPPLLREISAAPFIIYYKGSLTTLFGQNKNRLAVVGPREPSAYAEKVINNFLPALIDKKIEIVSGLAIGVDALAHEATLNNRGVTIAVLGSGLDKNNFYPTSNKNLGERIIKNGGVIISEFPPRTPPLKQNFPQRNRIISGLAQATLVIEAKNKSGSLITADYALDQNREVLAIPGNIFSEYSIGTNNLIQLGAKTIAKPEDIMEIFKINRPASTEKKRIKTKEIIFENEVEKIIYEILNKAQARAEKITTDEIIKLTKLDTSVINSTLSILELRGIAKSDGISYYIN